MDSLAHDFDRPHLREYHINPRNNPSLKQSTESYHFNTKIIIHELIDFIYPHFKKVYLNTMKSKKVYSFKNFNQFIHYYYFI